MSSKELIFIFFTISLAFITIILSLYPYWIYGNFSAFGWYDEYYQQIPWWFNQAKLSNQNGFLYGYAGGLGGLVGKGSQYILGQQLFINFSPLWISLLFYRVLSLFLTFLGFYIFSKFIIKNNNYSSLLLSLFPLYISIEIYTTTFAGVGWHYAAIIWFAVISSIKLKNYISDVIFVTFYILLTTTNASPFFLLPSIFLFYIFLRTSLDSKYFLDKRAFTVFIILTICMLINSLPNFITLFEVKDYSARLTKVLTNFHDVNNINFFDYLTNKIVSSYELFKMNFNRNHHEVMFYSYSLIILLFLIYNKYSFLIKVIFFSFIIYPALNIAFGILNLPIISAYRWDILVGLLSSILAISFMYLEKNKHKNANRKIVVIDKIIDFILLLFILVSILISINSLTKSTMLQLSYGGGLGIINEYKGLNNYNYTKNKYRFISGDSETLPSLPTYYSLDTFDGAATHFSERRNYYVAYAMFDKPKNYLHTHHHIFNNFPNEHNIKAFKRANIKFINYSKLLEETNFIFESKYIGKTINKKTVVNPLYIYSLDDVTPRIFLADKLITSHNSYTDQKFYLELNKLGLLDALVAKEDILNDYNITFIKGLEISEKIFSDNKVVVKFKSFGDGFLVFNQVFTPEWSAKCGNKDKDIIPMNGIMMGVLIDNDECKTIEFKYN